MQHQWGPPSAAVVSLLAAAADLVLFSSRSRRRRGARAAAPLHPGLLGKLLVGDITRLCQFRLRGSKNSVLDAEVKRFSLIRHKVRHTVRRNI